MSRCQYRRLKASELPDFAKGGFTFDTITVDPDTYLRYLQESCSKRGAHFRRASLKHIEEAFASSGPIPSPDSGADGAVDIVVNCSGLGARELGGVEDKRVNLRRGQIVLVENKCADQYFASESETLGPHEAEGEVTYIIPRRTGTFQKRKKTSNIAGAHFSGKPPIWL